MKADAAARTAPDVDGIDRPAPPATMILVHPKERRSKCTAAPLRDRPGFQFVDAERGELPDLKGYVRLEVGAPLLTLSDSESGLLILDGTWRRARQMLDRVAHVPCRGLPPTRTAYPRVSKLFVDPPEGLATIEAIYVAYRILGRDIDGLLDAYRWKNDFLALNPEYGPA